jgi:hypothetical protein
MIIMDEPVLESDYNTSRSQVRRVDKKRYKDENLVRKAAAGRAQYVLKPNPDDPIITADVAELAKRLQRQDNDIILESLLPDVSPVVVVEGPRIISDLDLHLISERVNQDMVGLYIRAAFDRIGFLPSPLVWERDGGSCISYDGLCSAILAKLKDMDYLRALGPIILRIVPGYTTNVVAVSGLAILFTAFSLMNEPKLGDLI